MHKSHNKWDNRREIIQINNQIKRQCSTSIDKGLTPHPEWIEESNLIASHKIPVCTIRLLPFPWERRTLRGTTGNRPSIQLDLQKFELAAIQSSWSETENWGMIKKEKKNKKKKKKERTSTMSVHHSRGLWAHTDKDSFSPLVEHILGRTSSDSHTSTSPRKVEGRKSLFREVTLSAATTFGPPVMGLLSPGNPLSAQTHTRASQGGTTGLDHRKLLSWVPSNPRILHLRSYFSTLVRTCHIRNKCVYIIDDRRMLHTLVHCTPRANPMHGLFSFLRLTFTFLYQEFVRIANREKRKGELEM